MEQSKVWDHFQNEGEIGDVVFNARLRYEFLAQQIAPSMPVLNMGVAHGGVEATLLNKGVLVSSLDPSESAIDCATIA